MYGISALSSEFLISDSTVYDMTHHTEKTSQVRDMIVFGSAIVEAEYLFIYIAIQVERFYADVRAFQSALQEAPKILHAVGVDLPVNVFLCMVNHLMSEILMVQTMIGKQRIGIDRTTCADVLPNLSLQDVLAARGNNIGADFATALQYSEHSNLVLFASLPFYNLAALALVHVACRATDESFVHFHFLTEATELHNVLIVHRKANPLEHEPRGLLGDAKSACQFIGADAVLAVRQHPDSNHPLVHAESGILEDGSDLDRELLLASLTKPNIAGRDERVLCGLAAWANDLAALPTQLLGIFKCLFRVREENNGFLEGFRELHSWLQVCVHG